MPGQFRNPLQALLSARPSRLGGAEFPAGGERAARLPAREVRLAGGIVIGGGVVHPEVPLRAASASDKDAQRLRQEARAVLAAADGRVQAIVLDLDLAATPGPAGWTQTVASLHAVVKQASPVPVALRLTLPAGGDAACLAAGAVADILSVESLTGLALFQAALPAADIQALILSIAALAAPAAAASSRQVVQHLRNSKTVCSGDCSRPFVAEILRCWREGKSPEVFCAIALAVCAVRSLASFEAGARGPARPGAWECLLVKAIQGCPVSLTGTWSWDPRVAAMADLWNGGGSLERSFAECRALSVGGGPAQPAPKSGGALSWILNAASIRAIADAIQTCELPYQRAIAAAYAAANLLGEGALQGKVPISAAGRELLASIDKELFLLPESDQELLGQVRERYGQSITSGEINQ